MHLKTGDYSEHALIADFQIKMAMETESLMLDHSTVMAGVKKILDEPERGEYLVAYDDHKVIGSMLILSEWSDWRNRTIWWIHSLYVLPEYRKKGVFKVMFAHLKKQMEERADIGGIRLYVDKRNTSARQVYEKLGMDGDHYQVFELMK
jgi:GNAT superfamily N-acetyltransferase